MIDRMEAYRTPDERFAGLPDYTFAPRYLSQDGLRMHYVEEERATRCCCSTASRAGRSCTGS